MSHKSIHTTVGGHQIKSQGHRCYFVAAIKNPNAEGSCLVTSQIEGLVPCNCRVAGCQVVSSLPNPQILYIASLPRGKLVCPKTDTFQKMLKGRK